MLDENFTNKSKFLEKCIIEELCKNKDIKYIGRTKFTLSNRWSKHKTNARIDKENNNPMFGKKRPDTIISNIERTGWKHTNEVKQKMTDDRTGEKNANYKHGKRTKKYMEEHKNI